MTPATPVCDLVNGVKTIYATANADSMMPGSAWSTWIVTFLMDITNPSDLLGVNPSIMTRIYNPNNMELYAY